MNKVDSKFWVLWAPYYGYLGGSSRYVSFTTDISRARKFSRKNHAGSCRKQKFVSREWEIREIDYIGFEKTV